MTAPRCLACADLTAPCGACFTRALMGADARVFNHPMVAATMRRNDAREQADREARSALADSTAKAWRGLVADAAITDEVTP